MKHAYIGELWPIGLAPWTNMCKPTIFRSTENINANRPLPVTSFQRADKLNSQTQFSFPDKLDFGLEFKRSTKKINVRLCFKKMELGFVDSGQHVDFKPID